MYVSPLPGLEIAIISNPAYRKSFSPSPPSWMTRQEDHQHSNIECVVLVARAVVARVVAGSHDQNELLEVRTAETVSVEYFRVAQMG